MRKGRCEGGFAGGKEKGVLAEGATGRGQDGRRGTLHAGGCLWVQVPVPGGHPAAADGTLPRPRGNLQEPNPQNSTEDDPIKGSPVTQPVDLDAANVSQSVSHSLSPPRRSLILTMSTQ